jgi:hypothetical protein
MVLPAIGSVDPGALSMITRAASSAIKSSGLKLSATPKMAGTASRAGIGTSRIYSDQDLLDLGELALVEYVVFPMFVQPQGAPPAIRVQISRTTKGRIWSCLRPLNLDESEDSPLKKAEKATRYCVEQLLSPAKHKKIGETKKRIWPETRPSKSIEWPKERYIGLTATVIPRVGQERLTLYDGDKKISTHLHYEISGGVGFFFEKNITSWITFGFQLEYQMLWFEDPSGKTIDTENLEDKIEDAKEHLGLFDMGMTARFLYPGKWIEPYFKVSLSLGIMVPPEKKIYEWVDLSTGFGTSYQARGGIMLTVPHFAVFIDCGLHAALWFPGVTESEDVYDRVLMSEVALAINTGIAYTF